MPALPPMIPRLDVLAGEPVEGRTARARTAIVALDGLPSEALR